MKQIRRALARIAGVFTKDRMDADLREEMEAHLEMEVAENVRRGMSPEAARRKALLSAGGMTQAVEAVRDQRGLPSIEGIASDFKYAFRALRHTPGFTAVVVITLALGIGANTAIFSVVRGVLLKPLPHRDGDRLVYLRHSADVTGSANINFSVPEVRDFRTGAPSLGGVAEYSPWSGTLESADNVTRLEVGLVTGNFFEVMGLASVLGRVTNASDDGPGVPPVMVLTHEFWQEQFAGDSSIIGRQVRISGTSVTVIGVLQPAPYFPDRVSGFLNMVFSPHHLSAQMVEDRIHRMTEMIARLAPGATVEQARTEVAAVDARMQSQHPQTYDAASRYRVTVLPFKEAIGQEARLTLWLLMAAAAFVLIICAANVVNLTLMRGVRRELELVVRAALGAGVTRLRRMLLVENLVLTFMGAAFGVVIAIGGVKLLTSLVERYSPRASEIQLDGTVLGFTAAVATILALVISMAASLPKEGKFAAWISAGVRRMSGSLRKQRLQRALVVAQIAVSVVLLAGAGLLTRTLIRLNEVDTGLSGEIEQVITMPLPLFNPARITPDNFMQMAGETTQQYQRIQNEVRALPGVLDVGVGSTMPLLAGGMSLEVKAQGKVIPPGEPLPRAEWRTATPEYFRAAGIRMVKGREFTITDRPGGGRVAIINQSLADRYFPNEDPIGKQIAFTGEILRVAPVSGDWRTIVGVVANTQDGGLDKPPVNALFAPFVQEIPMAGGLVIRTASDVDALIKAATQAVRRIAPLVPIENVRTIAQIREQSVSPRRLNAVLISSFGILAVIIAAVGIAGVLAFSVSSRTNEIGIRMSLGADSGRVLRMILHEGGVLLALGLMLGMVAAFFASSVIRELLFGVAPRDPATFVGVAALMGVIGLGACLIPALRAARVDPAITMRS